MVIKINITLQRMVYTNPTLEVAEDINNVTQLQLQDEGI